MYFFTDGFDRVWFGELNMSPDMQVGHNIARWLKAFRVEMLEEVVDMQLALLEARSSSAPQEALLSKVRRFEILVHENWSWHSSAQPQQSYVSRLEYLDDHEKIIAYESALKG